MVTRELLTASLLMACMPVAVAHHSTAIYDKDTHVAASGTVTDWFTGRPHYALTFVGSDEFGNEQTYVLDFGGISSLPRENNWDDSTFQVGDRVSVVGNPSQLRNDNRILVESLGTEFGEYSVQPREPTNGTGPPFFVPIPEEIELPTIEMLAMPTAWDWADPAVIVNVHGDAEGQPPRDYEVHLPGATALLEEHDFSEDDLQEDANLIVAGFLVEEGGRAMVFPAMFGILGQRGLRFPYHGLQIAHDYLGLEYTPPEGDARATGRPGPPGGVRGAAGRGPGGAGGPAGQGPGGAGDAAGRGPGGGAGEPRGDGDSGEDE